jgi:hypothetical protein
MTSLERPPASTSGRQVTDAGDILELTYDTLDSETIIKSVQDNGAGAVAVFIGTTRDTFEGTRSLEVVSIYFLKTHVAAPGGSSRQAEL